MNKGEDRSPSIIGRIEDSEDSCCEGIWAVDVLLIARTSIHYS